PGIRQYQFGQRAGGIVIHIVPMPGYDPQSVSNAVLQIATAVLADLGASEGSVDVDIVDRIERAGAGAKQKIVASTPMVDCRGQPGFRGDNFTAAKTPTGLNSPRAGGILGSLRGNS